MCCTDTEKKDFSILIVEDEAIVAMDLEHIVKSAGYTVAGIAVTADDAVKMTAEKNPGLVLMDIILCGCGDGIDAAVEIRKTSDVPILFCTANADPETIARIRSVTHSGCLIKPLSARTLYEKISLYVPGRSHVPSVSP